MSVDPDSIAERSRTVSESELKMTDTDDNETEEFGKIADIEAEMREKFNF